MSGVDETESPEGDERPEDGERPEESEREAWPETPADPGAAEPDEELSRIERGTPSASTPPGSSRFPRATASSRVRRTAPDGRSGSSSAASTAP